ncbi:hypothetical protein Tco_0989144 [Tanacetum coccineum]|uniref:Uncharacterized protein n=1 Tax=Tanacetum coccineum TaxID=301880 RepID=A0ABQ5ETY1_9ASTR
MVSAGEMFAEVGCWGDGGRALAYSWLCFRGELNSRLEGGPLSAVWKCTSPVIGLRHASLLIRSNLFHMNAGLLLGLVFYQDLNYYLLIVSRLKNYFSSPAVLSMRHTLSLFLARPSFGCASIISAVSSVLKSLSRCFFQHRETYDLWSHQLRAATFTSSFLLDHTQFYSSVKFVGVYAMFFSSIGLGVRLEWDPSCDGVMFSHGLCVVLWFGVLFWSFPPPSYIVFILSFGFIGSNVLCAIAYRHQSLLGLSLSLNPHLTQSKCL